MTHLHVGTIDENNEYKRWPITKKEWSMYEPDTWCFKDYWKKLREIEGKNPTSWETMNNLKRDIHHPNAGYAWVIEGMKEEWERNK